MKQSTRFPNPHHLKLEDKDSGQKALPTGQILVGDAVERLRQLPSRSVNTVITSPPYFRLRNYQAEGQLGAEETVQQWVEGLLAVMEELARVLRDDGTVWLNLGDTYSRHLLHGAPPKSLVLAPERLLLALNQAGWSCRNKIVWAKPNPMPASVRDRLTTTWEPLYLLTRSRSYFFDLDAIRVPARSDPPSAKRKYRHEDAARRNKLEKPGWAGPNAGSNSGLAAMKARGASTHLLGKNPGDVWEVATAAFHGPHFATSPAELVERPLLSGCPERVCSICSTPWRRAHLVRRLGEVAVAGVLRKSCSCPDRAWSPGIVLDPFFGAGTVGLVAEQLGRRWVGIELNPEFAQLARSRISSAPVTKPRPPPCSRRGPTPKCSPTKGDNNQLKKHRTNHL